MSIHMEDVELDPNLTRWLRRNARDVVAVMAWLHKNPTEFNTIATLAHLADNTGPDVVNFAEPDAERERVLEWMRSAIFAACAQCYQPVITFQNGKKLAWPDLTRHDCGTRAVLR